MSGGSVYGADDYDVMFADPVRREAYLEAIARTVRAGDIVVEIGTGVGYFAVAACRAGARRVYAIERERSVALAERLAAENHLGERIICIRGDSTRIALPERGAVLVHDLRGAIPLMADAIPTIVDARHRHLTPAARLIAERDTIRAAPCSSPRRWASVELELGLAPGGISRGTLAARARSQLRSDRLAGESLCAEPAIVAVLDYAEITSPDIDSELTWVIDREASIEGIALWFDAELAGGVTFSTAPGATDTVYGHAFLPLERAIIASAGDTLAFRLRARLLDGEYVMAWDTEWTPARSRGAPVRFRHSSLGSLVATAADLEMRHPSFRPSASRLTLVRELATLADGTRTITDIAETLWRAHPQRFESSADALTWAYRCHAALDNLSSR